MPNTKVERCHGEPAILIDGVPVDYYFHDDVSRADMPDYKLYIAVNLYHLTKKERKSSGENVTEITVDMELGQTRMWCANGRC